MAKLSLNDILEAEFIERIGLSNINIRLSLKDLALFKRISEPI